MRFERTCHCAISSARRAARESPVSTSGGWAATPPSSAVREDIDVLPAREIEFGAAGEEVETGLGQPHAAFTDQYGVQFGLQRVKMQYVGGGIGLLLLAELGRAPVRALLLLGELNAEQFARYVLQPVAIGVGA